MDKTLVKSRGVACAAPPITDPKDAVRDLGKMRFKLLSGETPDQPNAVQLLISHPNTTGLQKNQISLLYIPEHYVKGLQVSFNDQLIMDATTTYLLSENPSFRFTFQLDEEGELVARMIDTKDKIYTLTQLITPQH